MCFNALALALASAAGADIYKQLGCFGEALKRKTNEIHV
jgi:hypothetical protein